MKKLATFLFLITTVVLFTSKIAFAEDQVPATNTVAASTAIVTPAAPAQSVTNAVYAELLSKIEIKNNLILKENQVCKEIKAQENINKEKVASIIRKYESYSADYNKIIDDIKALQAPIREKQALYYKYIIQNKTATPKNTDTSNTSGTEASIYDSQLSNLNLAIKAMRESIKYISLESVRYRQDLEAVQKNIDKMNLSIEELNKEIFADKVSKDKEWNNFISAMVKGDLKAANESYDNLIKLKEHIIQNYNGILMYKKSIGEQLASIEK